MLTVGDTFPAFKLQGVDSANELVEVSVEENYEPLKKDWSVIYFYPKDFTFICPTEISAMDKLVDEATVIGISGDNEFCKLAWKNDNSLIAGCIGRMTASIIFITTYLSRLSTLIASCRAFLVSSKRLNPLLAT